MNEKFVKIEPISDTDKLLYKYCTTIRKKGYIEFGIDKTVLPEYYTTIADEIENFEVKDSDIWITSYPKTGVTWAEEMIWLIANNLDFEGAKQPQIERCPFIEFKCTFDNRDPSLAEISKNVSKAVLNSVENARDHKDPRIIKSHLPFQLLPKQIRDKTKKPKMIHVMRNPKDTCVSFYHYIKLTDGYKGTFEEFCQMFLEGRMIYGSFWKNIMSYFKIKDEYNILFLTYEDMKQNLPVALKQTAQLLGKTLSDEQIRILEDHLSFNKMKNNKSVNMEDYFEVVKKINKSEGCFMRSGTVGSYKNDMTPEMIKKFDEWTKENTAGTGLSFKDV